MFSKVALFTIVSFAAFVAALPSPGGGDQHCESGEPQCCMSISTFLPCQFISDQFFEGNSFHEANSDGFTSVVNYFNLADVVAEATGAIGVDCNNVLLSGNSWYV